jgi:hypothetical protein
MIRPEVFDDGTSEVLSDLVAAWERSGLSRTEFCRQRGVKLVTFAWWKRRLASADRADRFGETPMMLYREDGDGGQMSG